MSMLGFVILSLIVCVCWIGAEMLLWDEDDDGWSNPETWDDDT